jgi:tripartite ATP-independent transporter DctM subunit
MSIGTITILFIVAMMVLFAPGFPIYVALGTIALGIGYLLQGTRYFAIVSITTSNLTQNFLLVSLPLFLFMGYILQTSGLANAMFKAVYIWTARIRGGLAVAAISVCTAIAAMVGTIGPGVLTMGTIAVPAMLKHHYDKRLTVGSVMAGGTLGQLIPPSLDMIAYAMVANVSLGRLFAGGMVPGLMLSFMYMLYVWIRCKINPALAPLPPPNELPTGSLLQRLWKSRDAFTAFALIGAVLGTIFAGLATPTEAAAVGALGAILISVLYRNFNWKIFRGASLETFKITATIGWLLLSALIYSNFYMISGGVHLVEGIVKSAGIGPWQFVIITMVTIMILGCIMDDFVIVLLVGPLFTPIAVHFGFDPVWYGILIMINLQTAFLTPPYGFALFYMRAVVPSDITMRDIYMAIWPFVALQVLGLTLVIILQPLVLWLPNLIFQGK